MELKHLKSLKIDNSVTKMRGRIFLVWILLYSAVLRFWRLGQIPPLIDQSFLLARYTSAFLSLASVFLLYYYSKVVFKNVRLALLSAFVFMIAPWVLEQGRIVSQPNNSLFFILIILLWARVVKQALIRILLYASIFLILYIIYPQFWLFKTNHFNVSLINVLNNIFILLSPEFFFFKNPTFWWGGVRDFGILYLAWLPFLLVGLNDVVVNKKQRILLWISIVLLISVTSPFFPESREFFIVTPFISLIVASGIYKFFSRNDLLTRVLFFIVFVFMIYEIVQYFHYYTIHYPQQILGNRGHINEPF